jgi:hypothetical protein
MAYWIDEFDSSYMPTILDMRKYMTPQAMCLLETLMICSCSYQYTFQEYIRNFNNHRMPGGNALHVFQEYVEKWPCMRTVSEKMFLIDWMIHQCHISMASGLPLRSVVKNLIDAPQKTAEKIILELAYDDIS